MNNTTNRQRKEVVPKLPYEFMFSKVSDYMHLNWEDLSLQDALFQLMEFEVIFGQDGIIAMYGWLRFASNRKLAERKIKSAISHDINGMKTSGFEPRTTDYFKFCND